MLLKQNWISWFKKICVWSLTYYNEYLNHSTETDISQSCIYSMAAKANWHRYGTKFRYCHLWYWLNWSLGFNWFYFYRAMLCIRGTSHGPVSVSVCLSVTSRCSTKTAKRRNTQTTPYDTPGTLVFWCQRSPLNSTGVSPYEGAECRWGVSKSATFD